MTIVTTGATSLGGTTLTIAVNPKATYLRTNLDPLAVDAVPIDLAALGILPGQLLDLQTVGDFAADGTSNEYGWTGLGIFSSSATPLSPEMPRVTYTRA